MENQQTTPVLIVGSGSAGLCAATWLARCGIPFSVIEKRDGPLARGQADGVQCRTVEVFDSFGISEELLREAHHIREVTFWAADSQTPLRRTGVNYDSVPGSSHQPHVILNQARVNGLLIERMKAWNSQEVTYNREFQSVEVDQNPESEYPVKAQVINTETGKVQIMRSKFLLACDGAHSAVRHSLDYQMLGDSTDAVWGVMDVYARTDFPDIRKKSTIRTPTGTLLVIPREGGRLVRFYIQMSSGTVAATVKLEHLIETSRKIFNPFSMEVVEVVWWSAYSIGQRLADSFSYKNRVFLTGDSCHTHSPKAGQGMNTSLQDGYDLGWKLAQVEEGIADPEMILPTYSLERGKVAQTLIEFDRYYSELFAKADFADPAEFNKAFVQSLLFTAGLTAQYDQSALTLLDSSFNNAKNVKVGMRLESPLVVRLCDAKTIHLTQAMPADGRWRIILFPGDVFENAERFKNLNTFGEFIDSSSGPARKYLRRPNDDYDSIIETIVVLTGERGNMDQFKLHPHFMPINGPWKTRDLHKVFVDGEGHESPHGHVYERFGIDPGVGAVLIVRPDHHISAIFSISEQDRVAEFFSGFMRTCMT